MAHFDPADPVFAGLPDNVKNHLNAVLAARLTAANQGVRVTNFNTCIEVPIYDSKKMTSASFFKQCRTYLNSQGYTQANHHEYLPILMKNELQWWYDSVSSEIQNWNDFETRFSARYDNAIIRAERARLLHSRQQQQSDPSEQFIYELYNLSKQVNPLEEEKVLLLRIREVLVPDISALVGDFHPWTLDKLLENVSVAHSNLNRQARQRNGMEANIAPFSRIREEIANSNSTSFISANGFENSFSDFGEGSSIHDGNHYDCNIEFGEGNPDFDNFNARSFEGESDPNEECSHTNYSEHVAFHGICHQCMQYGHKAQECPNNPTFQDNW
jgi:hypothetical protein